MHAFLLHSGEPGIESLMERLRFAGGTSLPETKDAGTLLIQWGVYQPEHGRKNVLQPVKSMLLALNPERAASVLRMHGVDCTWDTSASAGRAGLAPEQRAKRPEAAGMTERKVAKGGERAGAVTAERAAAGERPMSRGPKAG
ncbi:hypothetical protein LJK87_08590 [Paenibacillus sp. P25]|nr:hypothetical protein LJK87_08590 [Paenibacillus sp. P25]